MNIFRLRTDDGGPYGQAVRVVHMEWSKMGEKVFGSIAPGGTESGILVAKLNSSFEVMLNPYGTHTGASPFDCRVAWWNMPDGISLNTEPQEIFNIPAPMGNGFRGPSFSMTECVGDRISIGIINNSPQKLLSGAGVEVFAR